MLRFVRGTFENTHGYRCPQRVALSSGPEHDVAFLTSGAPFATRIHILETQPVPERLQRSGRTRLLLAYAQLAGANDLRLTLDELVPILLAELDAPTYGAT
jgi:hypothetical protein